MLINLLNLPCIGVKISDGVFVHQRARHYYKIAPYTACLQFSIAPTGIVKKWKSRTHTHTHTVNKNDDSLDTAEFQSAVLFYFHRFAGWPLFSKLDKFRPPEYVCHCGARWGPIYLCQLLPRRFGSVARHDRKKIPNR